VLGCEDLQLRHAAASIVSFHPVSVSQSLNVVNVGFRRLAPQINDVRLVVRAVVETLEHRAKSSENARISAIG